LTLNVQRVFTLTQKLVPLLKAGYAKDGAGRVINVSHRLAALFPRPVHLVIEKESYVQIGSINGLGVPAMETYAYSASKAALHQQASPAYIVLRD
jgi:NAD(P)-dependent dehydrogenase (short-subunit alcohol dehydrogenase family)